MLRVKGVFSELMLSLSMAWRAFRLVWSAGPLLSLSMVAFSFINGVTPAATAYVAAKVIDTITYGITNGFSPQIERLVLMLVVAEATLLIASSILGKVNGHLSSLLSDQLSENVKTTVLEKTLSIDYAHFENPEFNDKLLRANGDPGRPLGVVNNWLGLTSIIIGLVTAITLLSQYSVLAVVVVIISAIPGFFINISWSKKHFLIEQARAPIHRRQQYLQQVLTQSMYMKEVKSFGFGRVLLDEYTSKVRTLAKDRRRIAIQQSVVGTVIELISTLTLYVAYGSVALAAASGSITIGQMTLYMQMFRQAQGSISSLFSSFGGIYSGRLHLSPLFDFLDMERSTSGDLLQGPLPGDGLRFVDVGYQYPGCAQPAVEGVSFHIRPGQSVALVGENGAGKSTLVKLLTRLYHPTAGKITLDGLELDRWNEEALRARMSALFQDYRWYGFSIGENIGLGNVASLKDEQKWMVAAESGLAKDIVDELPERYHTQLGSYFGGIELSGGQWQRVALSRTYMREDADVIVLDEPAAAIDSITEMRMLERFKEIMKGRIAILISHRFSTVRLADRIIVLEHGKVIEDGSHAELIALNGHYARMYNIQAEGYQ